MSPLRATRRQDNRPYGAQIFRHRRYSWQSQRRRDDGGNRLARRHGGILASFGEVAAAAYLARQRGDNELPLCSTMTFDYLRPAFMGSFAGGGGILR